MAKQEDVFQSVGARLRWARTQAGLTQAQVAKKFGWNRPTVSQIEADERAVKSHELEVFADLYDMKLEWLIKGDAATKSNPRVELAARELSKLSTADLGTLLRVISVLKSENDD